MREMKQLKICAEASTKRIAQFWVRQMAADGLQLSWENAMWLATEVALPAWARL